MNASAQARQPTPPQPTRRRALHWTAEELAVITTHYVSGGMAACAAQLPGRSQKQIYSKAVSMGMRRQKERAATKESTDWIDAAIRRFYREAQPRGAHQALAKRLGVTRQWLSTRAATLGVMPVTRPDMAWTPEEDALLEKHAHKRSETIGRILRGQGYLRTPSAIGIRLRLMGIDRLDPDVFTAQELARCMGVDSHVPLRWIERHGLKAKRVGAADSTGRTTAWAIRRADLREFLTRSADWDHRRCERAWLVDILS